jgi:hypothetical protein
MDLLRAAVADITTLVATCRALRIFRLTGESGQQRKLRVRIRRELKRGTVAYIDTLARSKRGTMDEGLLSACRVAAEQEMACAIRHHPELKRLMNNESGVLNGVSAARHDLWRLSNVAFYLRLGFVAIRDVGVHLEAAKAPAGRLRRRFRRALVAYARTSHRDHEGKEMVIGAARVAALAEIGKRGLEDAARLCELELRAGEAYKFIQTGVAKPLHDLILDWRPPEN